MIVDALLEPYCPPPGTAGSAEAAIVAAGGTVHWLTAADGVRLRAASWERQGEADRGGILLLSGRTEFIEKYFETVAALRRRGFSVWMLDWRGQGHSGRLLADRAKGHAARFEDFVADLALFIRGTVLPALGDQPLALLAHSMGGNIGLRYLHDHPGVIARAAFSAPMIDFLRGGLPLWLVRALGGIAGSLSSWSSEYGPGQAARRDDDELFEGNKLTTCPHRFERTRRWLRHDPALHLGGVTWGWLRAAGDSVARIGGPGFAEAIRIPVLIVIAGNERIADNAAIRRFAARLPKGRLEVIPGAEHEILAEADALRACFWEAFDEFMELPPEPPRGA